MTDVRNRGSRAPAVVTSALAFGVYLVLSAVPAQAVTCNYVAVNSTVEIDLDVNAESATIEVGPGGAIEVNGVACGIATVTTTNGVSVTASGGGSNTFTIDQTNGVFQPGESPETTGTAEIEFTIDLGAGAVDVIEIVGTAGDDVITVGGGNASDPFLATANLNGDNDADMNVISTLNISVDGADGNDTISGAGGNGTGDDTGGNVGLTPMLGGNGNDFLEGSDNLVPLIANVLNGQEGNDHISGRGGNDVLQDTGLIGGPGAVDADGDGNIEPDEDETDLFEGGDGEDRVNAQGAGEGNDTIRGGNGDDSGALPGLFGGEDDDLFDEEDGPNGADEFEGGSGSDTVSYAGRNSDVNATNDNVDDDGETGANEGDDIDDDVENMIGGSGNDFIDDFPPSDDSFLAGGAGDDEILGDDGDDVLQGGPGNDTMDGELPGVHTPNDDPGSSDAVDYTDAPSGVVVDVDAGTATGGAGNDTFSDIEDVFGSDFDDTILGDEAENALSGNGGNDTMDGRGDGDFVLGGDGNDTITDSGTEVDEQDFVIGAAGNDSVDAGIDDDLALGDGEGEDETDGNDTVEGGEGSDILFGGGGDDTVTDSGLDDGTDEDEDDDVLFGGDGNDTLTTDQGDDQFDGDDGDQTGTAGDGNDVFVSGDGDDFGLGDGGNDTITDDGLDLDGGLNDEFFGCDGDDVINLGEGNDLGVGDGVCSDISVSFSAQGDGASGVKQVNECFLGGQNFNRPAGNGGGAQNPGDDDIFGQAGDDSLWGCEEDDLVEGGNGEDEIFGGDDTDTLRGDAGEDFIEGEDGADKVEGGLDDDELDGDGAGSSAPDTLLYNHLVDANGNGRGQDVDLQLGFSEGDDGNDIVMNFEKAKGSKFDDTIKGGGGAQATNFFLAGGGGDDVLTGSGSNDTLKGAGGNDLLIGLQGGDTLKGGKGNDEGQGGPGADVCFKVEQRVSCQAA